MPIYIALATMCAIGGVASTAYCIYRIGRSFAHHFTDVKRYAVAEDEIVVFAALAFVLFRMAEVFAS